jgi:sugar phosphate isomerase/epimerase
VVCRADAPNLGLGFDSFHLLATQTPMDELEMLDPAKIFLVQLADFMWNEVRSNEEKIATARHFRVFPGEGVHSEALAQLVRQLHELGYRGDYSFEVFNDDYQQIPLPVVAQRAHAARPCGWAKRCCAARCRCPTRCGSRTARRAEASPEMTRARVP